MYRSIVFFLLLCFSLQPKAQLVEVRADYTTVGDVQFSAYNNTKAPLYLNIDFADLENTTFDEPLPYIKLLEPGFNSLFMLHRRLDADVPRFNYQMKTYRSNPMAVVDLDFPYLIPLENGRKANVFDVRSIAGFWGNEEPDSWNVTGFKVKPGDKVFAGRTGTVAEITGLNRSTDPALWYHTWNNSVTVLLPDGTLMVYRNIELKNKELELGEKIFAGQYIGDVVPRADELILVVFQHSLNDEDPRFIIPQFVTAEDKQELLISAKEYDVVHPDDIIQREMTRKEIRKFKRQK
ncbi:MAG: hypothetical protein ACOC1J_00575 [Prolixibacteraceae bacterium]